MRDEAAGHVGSPLTAQLGLVERLRQQFPDVAYHRDQLHRDAADEIERQKVQINGLMFDALGEPRIRYVRVTLDGSHCVMDAREGDRYVQEAREAGDDSEYTVADVYLSEREFDDLPEHDGF